MEDFFSRQLMAWFEKEARDLPWRKTKDAYKIWICEIMSQQTTISGLLPFYDRFLNQFPSVEALANSKESEVLKAWEGLGYYSRARNIRRAAQMIVQEFNGRLPDDRKRLESLPGIGAYTAGAILSIAYGQRELAIDGNFIRVFSRFKGVKEAVDDPRVLKKIYTEAQTYLPKKSGNGMRSFTESVMDLGALICTPKSPKCSLCPIKSQCWAYKNSATEQIPFKKRRVLRHKLCELGYFFPESGKIPVLKKGSDPKYPDFYRLPYRSVKSHSEKSKLIKFKYSVTVRDFDYRIARRKPPESLLKKCVWKTPKQIERLIFPAIDRRVMQNLSSLLK